MSVVYFKYQAVDAHGKMENGQLNAESEKDALRILRGKNLTPVKIQESKQGPET